MQGDKYGGIAVLDCSLTVHFATTNDKLLTRDNITTTMNFISNKPWHMPTCKTHITFPMQIQCSPPLFKPPKSTQDRPPL